MFNLKIKYLVCMVVALALAPACKKSQKASTAPISPTVPGPEKQISVFDDDLEAFVIDEDASAFDVQDGFVLVDESEKDIAVEQSHYGFLPIYFEFDANCMKPAQNGALENNLARAKKLIAQGKRIVIEGHACKFAGSAEYNMHLSEQRAQCVYHYFVKNGIPKDKITVVGRGNEMCVIPVGDKEQQAPNRRVEFLAVEVA